jgi:hypothetical protein
MSKLTGIELKRAQLVPSAMFASPEAVVDAPGLSVAQKIAILRRWEFDVRRESGDSRVPGLGNELRLLEQVQLALGSLGVVVAPPPTGEELARH